MIPPLYTPLLTPPPPEPTARRLKEQRWEIIKASLLGGHTYDAALGYAKQHVTDEMLETAKKEDAERRAAWEARWREIHNRPVERSWLGRLLGI